jgi:hypothetical protein
MISFDLFTSGENLNTVGERGDYDAHVALAKEAFAVCAFQEVTWVTPLPKT